MSDIPNFLKIDTISFSAIMLAILSHNHHMVVCSSTVNIHFLFLRWNTIASVFIGLIHGILITCVCIHCFSSISAVFMTFHRILPVDKIDMLFPVLNSIPFSIEISESQFSYTSGSHHLLSLI
ncbi:MAG: hypothetical protein BWY04_00523 [candidate division CPR1 bacterium ADurb.Bin160]|uniref:Uncharacterized protein n=1 Tax=candidate division CPR1 bacterium ADurb.Bin160 TaxID=1852826 RepID=A0A1V5ZNQ9_9BACT|nr:MAG: hypothetical protein BWY04_00523 [candidate division CPR1 bacterium ADurb.Bin160]